MSDRRTTTMIDADTLTAIHRWPHWYPKSQLSRRVLGAQVVWTIKLDGPLDGPNVTDTLLDLLTRRGVVFPPETRRYALANLTGVLAKQVTSSKGILVNHALLARTVAGQRTKHLSILDGVELPPNPFPSEAKVDEVEPVAPEPVAEEPSRNGHRPEPVIVKTPTDKAMLILRLAGELALDLAAMPAPSSGDEPERLADALAEAERLRHRLAEESAKRATAEEQVASQRRVMDALKVQRDILQSNLDAAMRGERRPDDGGRRTLERLMREPARER